MSPSRSCCITTDDDEQLFFSVAQCPSFRIGPRQDHYSPQGIEFGMLIILARTRRNTLQYIRRVFLARYSSKHLSDHGLVGLHRVLLMQLSYDSLGRGLTRRTGGAKKCGGGGGVCNTSDADCTPRTGWQPVNKSSTHIVSRSLIRGSHDRHGVLYCIILLSNPYPRQLR